MFAWLFGKNKPRNSAEHSPPPNQEAGESLLIEAGQAFANASATATATATATASDATAQALQQAAGAAVEKNREQRKAERIHRREALFGVVRETMLKAGILSSAYKFKVLSIDPKGQHFLVLLDLSMDLAQSEPPERWRTIEEMITRSAKTRIHVGVQAVYWRYFDAEALSQPVRKRETGLPSIRPTDAAPAATPVSPAAAPIAAAVVAPLVAPSPAPVSAPMSAPLPEPAVAAAVSMPTTSLGHEAPAAANAPASGDSAAAELESFLADLRAQRQAASSAPATPATAPTVEPGSSYFESTQLLSRHEESVAEEELEAFRQALSQGRHSVAAPLGEQEANAKLAREPEPAAPVTDFPELDGFDDDFGGGGNLSATQYGTI